MVFTCYTSVKVVDWKVAGLGLYLAGLVITISLVVNSAIEVPYTLYTTAILDGAFARSD